MGFYQDLKKQDVLQTPTDIDTDEVLDDVESDLYMADSSEDLFGNVTDVEAALEKEIPALNDELMAVPEENTSESLQGGLDETESIDAGISEQKPEAVLELEEPVAAEEFAKIPEFDFGADMHRSESGSSDIEMPVVAEETSDSDISEAGVGAMLEKEISVLNEEPVTAEEENTTEDLQSSLDEPETIDAGISEQEPEAALASGEPVAEEEKNESDISEQETDAAESTDTAVITAGMSITGDVMSSGNMDLIGSITGNIEILGKLNVTGEINGNSSAAEIYADTAQITGEIRSKGSVKIGQSSVVIGNIFATSAVIAGAVKGDIDVNGPVILDASAIVMGNIKSKSVQINNGAIIEGMCSQCYADISPTSFFNDVKKNRKQA